MRMKRSLWSLALLALLAFPSQALAAGNTNYGCDVLDNSNTHQIIVKRVEDVSEPGWGASTTFDYATGTAYVRRLYPCTATLGHGGGSYVLGANLEASNRTDGIYQVGYSYDSYSGHNVAVPQFVYTKYATTTGYPWPGTLTPVPGHLIRFEITKNKGANTVAYRITDFATGETNAVVENAFASDILNLAWWGQERQNKKSQLGPPAGTAGVDMHYMGYSTDGSTNFVYRQNLKYGSEGGRDVYDTENDSLYYLGSWAYNRDMINSYNDGSPN